MARKKLKPDKQPLSQIEFPSVAIFILFTWYQNEKDKYVSNVIQLLSPSRQLMIFFINLLPKGRLKKQVPGLIGLGIDLYLTLHEKK